LQIIIMRSWFCVKTHRFFRLLAIALWNHDWLLRCTHHSRCFICQQLILLLQATCVMYSFNHNRAPLRKTWNKRWVTMGILPRKRAWYSPRMEFYSLMQNASTYSVSILWQEFSSWIVELKSFLCLENFEEELRKPYKFSCISH